MKWCPFRFDKQAENRDCVKDQCEWWNSYGCVVNLGLFALLKLEQKGEPIPCSTSTKSLTPSKEKDPTPENNLPSSDSSDVIVPATTVINLKQGVLKLKKSPFTATLKRD